MKTILDTQTAREVVARINQLNKDSKPLWGKMSIYQMLRHCAMWEEMLLERRIYKQAFIGKIFGRIALKNMLSDKPVKQNMPTVPSFRITDEGNVEAEKQRWVALIGEHGHRINTGFMHPFFGRLTADEAGRLAYKHVDHHLRQFGV